MTSESNTLAGVKKKVGLFDDQLEEKGNQISCFKV